MPLIHRAVEKAELSKLVQHLENQLEKKYSFENITGESEPKALSRTVLKKYLIIFLSIPDFLRNDIGDIGILLRSDMTEQLYLRV